MKDLQYLFPLRNSEVFNSIMCIIYSNDKRMCGFFPHTIKFSNTSEVPIIQLSFDTAYPQMASDPSGEGLSPTGPPAPPPLCVPIASSGCRVLLTDSSDDPSLGLVNLLEWITELREIVYLLDY